MSELARRLELLVQQGSFEEALRLAEQSDLGVVLVPRVHLAARDRDAALELVRQSMARACEPWDGLDLCRLAELAVEMGHRPLALACLRRALALDPDNAAARRGLYRLQRSLRWIEPLFARPPVPAWALHELGILRAEQGQVEAAIRFFRAAGDAYGHHMCAELHRRRSERRAEESACGQDGGFLWSRWRRACEREAEGDVEAALAELARTPARCEPELRQLRALWLERCGRRQEALELRLATVPARFRELYRDRLELIRSGRAHWHAYGERHRLRRLVVRAVVDSRIALDGAELTDFLGRWLPGLEFRLELQRRPLALDYSELEQAVESENGLWMSRRLGLPSPRPEHGEVLLVVIGGQTPWRATRGFGGAGLAVVQVDPQHGCAPTVVAHELMHAGLGLGHTDGEQAGRDVFGIMGHQGSTVALREAYLDLRQACHLASPAGVASLAEEIWESERAARWDQAGRAARELYRRDPLHLWGRARLAWSELRAGHCDRALSLLQEGQALEIGCESGLQLGELLLKLGRVEDGDRALEAVARSWPCSRTRVLAGLGRLRAVQPKEAAFDFHLAGGLDEESGYPLLGLAMAESDQGHHRRARRLLQRCLLRRPRWAAVLRRLALVEARLGDYQAARESLRRSRPLQRESADQAFVEGTVAWLAGDTDGARRRLKRACRIDHCGQVSQLTLGYVEFCTGNLRAARYRFAYALAIEPISFGGRCARCYLDWMIAERQRALGEASRLLGSDPREAALWLLLLLGARMRGRSEARARRRLRALEPNHPLL